MSKPTGHGAQFKPLSSVARFIRGITFKPDDKVDPGTKGSAVCMRTKNVQADLDESDLIAVPVDFVNRDEQFIKESDILVSTANSWNLVGKCSWVPRLTYVATAGGFISILRADEQVIFPRYLYYWFSSDHTQNDVRNCGRQTTNISNMSFERCLELKIPVPFANDRVRSLSEQKRIADILDKADAIRRKRQEAQRDTSTLAESCFLDLFGHPFASPKWPTKPIGQLGRVITGNTPSTAKPEYFGGSVPWVRPSELGDWKPVSRTDKTLTEDGLAVARSIRPGGVLVCCIGATLGKVGVVETESAFNQQINAIDFGPAIDDWYGMFCMRLMADHFVSEATHTTLPILNKGDFSKQQMPTPPIETQQQFGTMIKKLLQTRATLSVAEDASEQLFNSLVQRAFKGEL